LTKPSNQSRVVTSTNTGFWFGAEPEFVASVRAYGVMGHELVGNLFCERGTTAVALLSMRMTRASQVRI
jgi:hypothetical protein